MNKIVEDIENEVKKRCESSNNFYGIGAWSHIKAVEKNAVILAKKYDVDIELIRLAALLHDVASVTKKEYVKDHHIYGAKIAEELLNEYNYPKDKIEKIKRCILNHRGSVLVEKTTKEEICISDADAISHFDQIPGLFSMVYKEMGLSIEDGAKYLKDKLIRSYNKLTDETKELYKEKINNTMSIFEEI